MIPRKVLTSIGHSLQEGTPYSDWMASVAVAEDGAIFLAGATGGYWVGDISSGMDFALAKLDPDGEVLWRWQVTSCRSSWE